MKRRYSYPQAADELDVEESWLRRHIKRLPHTKLGRDVWFSDEDLDRIFEMHHHEPEDANVAAAPVPVLVGSHPLSHLKPLPARRGARTG